MFPLKMDPANGGDSTDDIVEGSLQGRLYLFPRLPFR